MMPRKSTELSSLDKSCIVVCRVDLLTSLLKTTLFLSMMFASKQLDSGSFSLSLGGWMSASSDELVSCSPKKLTCCFAYFRVGHLARRCSSNLQKSHFMIRPSLLVGFVLREEMRVCQFGDCGEDFQLAISVPGVCVTLSAVFCVHVILRLLGDRWVRLLQSLRETFILSLRTRRLCVVY